MARHDRATFGHRSITTIAVLRALQLGDLLCAIPAWRALRAAFPGAHITLIGLPWATSFVARFSRYFDAFLEFPGFPGLPEHPVQVERVPAFLIEAQRRSFDLVLQMHGNGTITNPLAALLGSRRLAGFYAPGGYCPDPCSFLPYPAKAPEVRRHLALMEFLGVPLQGEDLEFPVTDDDHLRLVRLVPPGALDPGRYIVVHPGGRAASRRWAVEGFAAVARRLADLHYRVVVTGTAEEDLLARRLVDLSGRPAINLAGRTDLGALAALLSRAALLVANDTGVSHVAAALKVASVIVCTGSDPLRWGPLDRRRHKVLVREAVTVDSVVAEAARLLGFRGRLAA